MTEEPRAGEPALTRELADAQANYNRIFRDALDEAQRGDTKYLCELLAVVGRVAILRALRRDL